MKKGWEVKKLGEVCELINGRAYKKKELLEKGKYLVLRVGNLFTNKKYYYSDLELSKEKLCEKGDLLYAWSASFGPFIWKQEAAIFHYHIWKVNFFIEMIDKMFLYYFFQWDTENIKSSYGTGTTMIHVSKSSIENRPIPLPPLEEQKRIVAVLDEAFEGIDSALETARKNKENARELFESELNSIFENKGKDWEEKKLGEVADLRPKKSEVKEKLAENDEVSFLPMADLEEFQRYTKPNIKRTLKDVYSSYTYFIENDVLLAKITPCFENGKLAVAKNLVNGVGFGSSEYFVFRAKEFITPVYLFYFLSQSKIREEGKRNMSGAVGHKRVIKSWIINLSIPLPSLEQQKQIVAKLDALSEETRRLEELYDRKILELEDLRKSILERAFNGEL